MEIIDLLFILIAVGSILFSTTMIIWSRNKNNQIEEELKRFASALKNN